MDRYFKKYVLLYCIIILTCLFYFNNASYGDCQGCCSWHGGVVCNNGVTKCADGTPLSSTCKAKGCNKCPEDTESSLISTSDDTESSSTSANDDTVEDKVKSGCFILETNAMDSLPPI